MTAQVFWRFHSSATRRHASSSTNLHDKRLAKALYRQLIRWCQNAGLDFPLSTLVVPVTASAPASIDDTILKSLHEGRSNGIQLPSNACITPLSITIPFDTVLDVKLFVQAIYRINHAPSVYQNQRVTSAFRAIKSLNLLTDKLNEFKQERNMYTDRVGVQFFVGQVVQHKTERWRAVIVQWDRITKSTSNSLTTKEYRAKDKPTYDKIQYTLLLDNVDAGIRSKQDTDFLVVKQSEISLVQNSFLCRIRNNCIQRLFERYDADTQSFVPNSLLAFRFPHDRLAILQDNTREEQRNKLGRQLIRFIQNFGSRLEQQTLEFSSSTETEMETNISSLLMTPFKKMILTLSTGNIVNFEEALSRQKEPSDFFTATKLLSILLKLEWESSGIMWTRDVAKQHVNNMQFKVGDTVVHTELGFRGVVVAWDHKPSNEVKEWFGTNDIENRRELPYYHVQRELDGLEKSQQEYTVTNDTGQNISLVCENDLEICSTIGTNCRISPGEQWPFEEELKRKFLHGEDLGAIGRLTEDFLNRIRDEITTLFISIREAPNENGQFSLHHLFEFLDHTDTMENAIVVERIMQGIWMAHEDHTIRKRLDDAISDLSQGEREKALISFIDIVNDDPSYAEAWNKISACQFLMGEIQASIESATKTLELIPTHFQALAGLGILQYKTRRYKLAAETFRRSLHLYPWSPVSSQLLFCLDKLQGLHQHEKA